MEICANKPPKMREYVNTLLHHLKNVAEMDDDVNTFYNEDISILSYEETDSPIYDTDLIYSIKIPSKEFLLNKIPIMLKVADFKDRQIIKYCLQNLQSIEYVKYLKWSYYYVCSWYDCADDTIDTNIITDDMKKFIWDRVNLINDGISINDDEKECVFNHFVDKYHIEFSKMELSDMAKVNLFELIIKII